MNISEEVIELIPKSAAKDIFCDFSEVALDATLDDGIMKDIPVIGLLVKAGGAIMTIRDRIFIKKVGSFLYALEGIPNKQRLDFLQNQLGDIKERRRVGEKLIMLIDKQDNLEKTDLLGYIFKAYIQGEISQDDFELLSHSVSHAHMPDLEALDVFTKGLELGGDALGSALFAINLAEMNVNVADATWGGTATATIEYTLSRLGITLSKIIAESRK